MTTLTKKISKLTFSARLFAAALLLSLAIGVIGAATSGAQEDRSHHVTAPAAPVFVTSHASPAQPHG